MSVLLRRDATLPSLVIVKESIIRRTSGAQNLRRAIEGERAIKGDSEMEGDSTIKEESMIKAEGMIKGESGID